MRMWLRWFIIKSNHEIAINPPVIAHRGVRSLAPENTIAAFAKAKTLGVNWIEFDVRLAACGELIVFHDDLLDRTTNAKGKVSDFAYSFLKTLDAGSWFDSRFSNEKIATLTDVLIFLNHEKMSANIEIKWTPGEEARIVRQVLDILKSTPLTQPFFISSFSRQILQLINQQSSILPLAFLMDKWQMDWKIFCDEIEAIAVDVNYTLLNAVRAQEIKATNRLLLAYTVNDPLIAKELFSMGVDAVFTDCPQKIL